MECYPKQQHKEIPYDTDKVCIQVSQHFIFSKESEFAAVVSVQWKIPIYCFDLL
jgi:hypothetical protein